MYCIHSPLWMEAMCFPRHLAISVVSRYIMPQYECDSCSSLSIPCCAGWVGSSCLQWEIVLPQLYYTWLLYQYCTSSEIDLLFDVSWCLVLMYQWYRLLCHADYICKLWVFFQYCNIKENKPHGKFIQK